jgi:hypothetical protein
MLPLALLSLSLATLSACDAATDTATDDRDRDGFTLEQGDCNDANPDVHPDAAETAGDGLDSNCNEDDDT